MATLTVEDRTATGKPVRSMTIDDLPEKITIRELIRTRVREEVARYNLRPGGTFSGLVQPTGAEAALNGFRMSKPRALDWERQAEIAVEAFGRNGFFVFVNGKQAIDLDQEVDLSVANDVAFVRLVPLVGG